MTDPDPTDYIDWLRQLLATVRSPLSPEMIQLRRTFEQAGKAILTAAEPFRAVTSEGVLRAFGLPPPDQLGVLLQRIAEGAERIRKLPETLRVALAGQVVLHPELSMPDLAAILNEYAAGGEAAAITKARELLIELLAEPTFRGAFEARWDSSGRWSIMREVLAAYDAQLYYVAIPAALAQAEGLVADFFSLPSIRSAALKARVSELHSDDDVFAPLAERFLEDLLVPFVHGTPVAQLNRHAVMHGGDSAYGSLANAVTAIMWADYVLLQTIEARSRRELSTGTPPEGPQADPGVNGIG